MLLELEQYSSTAVASGVIAPPEAEQFPVNSSGQPVPSLISTLQVTWFGLSVKVNEPSFAPSLVSIAPASIVPPVTI